MKKLIPLSLMCLFLIGIGTSQAQTADQPLGFKVKFGTQSYNGDLGNEINQFSDSDYLYGVGLAAYLSPAFDLGLDLQYMTLDKVNGPNDSVTKKRNTSFAEDNLDVNLLLHFKPFRTRLNPYLAAGVGANFLKNADNVKKKDSEFAFAIPFGIGVNYEIKENVMLNVQGIYHRTFTDKIDNYPLNSSEVTQTALNNEPQHNYNRNIDGINHDDYFTLSLGVVYNFGGGENEQKSMEERLLEQSMKNLKAAQNTSDQASNTLRQAQQLNDETLAALDSLRNAMSQTKEESNDLKAQMVHIVNNIQFEFDKATIIEPAHDELNSLANIMNTYPKLSISVAGHADQRGSNSYNKDLSQRRAEAVKDYLVDQGVDASRISTTAYGEDQPQMSGSSATSYGQNRSVRLTLHYNANGMMNDNDTMDDNQ